MIACQSLCKMRGLKMVAKNGLELRPSQMRLKPRSYSKSAKPVSTSWKEANKNAGKTWATKGDYSSSSAVGSTNSYRDIKNLNTQMDYEGAMEVWKQMREKGEVCDQYTYASILSTFRHLDDLQGSLEIIKEIREKDIWNEFIENQVLDIYGRLGESEKATEIFYNMNQRGLPVKTYSFQSLFKSLIDDGNVGDAIGMIIQFGDRFSQIDRSFYYQTIKNVISTENEAAIVQILNHILDKLIQLEPISYFVILHYLSKAKNVHDVGVHDENVHTILFDRFFNQLKSQGHSGYAVLLSFFTEQNDSKGAIAIWENLKGMPKLLTPASYAQLITVCAASGEVKKVEEIYEAMQKAQIDPSPSVQAALIRLYASNLDAEKASATFEKLTSEPSFVSPFLFNTMLDMYADMGDLQAADRILGKMSERNMLPNTSTFNSLINLHIRTSNPDSALKVFEQMREENIPMNYLTYKAIVDGLRQFGRLDEATQIATEAQSSPNVSKLGKSLLLNKLNSL